MMHLFLTSSPCDDAGGAALGLPYVYRRDNGFAQLLRARVQGARKAVMLAAWPDEHEFGDRIAAENADAFRALGLPLVSLRMLDSRHTREEIRQAVAESGIVLLSGGHVPTQNRWFHAIGLPGILAGFGGTVLGISAGSMNCCSTVYAQPELDGEAADPAYQRFLPGLGLTDIMILPHYNQVHDHFLDGLHLFRDISVPDSVGRTFYAIPDESFILQEDGHATLYGEGWRIRDGVMEKISEYNDITALQTMLPEADMYHFYGWNHVFRASRPSGYAGIATPCDLYDALLPLWSADTCAPRMRAGWSGDNPTLGQCSITAFLAQDIFGGQVFGVPLGDGNYHCYNVVDGCVFDLTSEQFGTAALEYRPFSGDPEQFRDVHFAKKEKEERYRLLRARLLDALSE